MSELLNTFRVCGCTDSAGVGEEDSTVAHDQQRRSQEAYGLLKFSPPPWNSVLNHQCPVGCVGPTPCNDRTASIQRGTEFIMMVSIHYMKKMLIW